MTETLAQIFYNSVDQFDKPDHLKKKVDGVWQLRDMEMIDEVRGTETKLEFELKAKE